MSGQLQEGSGVLWPCTAPCLSLQYRVNRGNPVAVPQSPDKEDTRNALPKAASVLSHPSDYRNGTCCGGGSYFWMLVKTH